MNYHLTEEQQALKREFEDFFREEMKNAPVDYSIHGPSEARYGTKEGFAFHCYMKKKLAEKGWLTMAWPKEYGGRDAPIIHQLLFNEVHGYFNGAGDDAFGVKMFGPTIMLYGSDEQKKRLLPPIARGEVQYCQGWSEPNAGSDLASLRTAAIKDGHHYVVNGQKAWTTGAHFADHMFLLARTDPSQKRNKGLSVFNVKMDTPGIEVRPIHYLNGRHTYNEVYFTDVKVPESERIGPENDGWKLTRATMNFERSNVANYASSKRAFDTLFYYTRTTKRGGKLLIDNPLVRQKLAKLYIDLERGRALAYKTGWLQEKGKLNFSPAMASEGKVFGSELAQRIANAGTEILGLYGQVETSRWAPMDGTWPDRYQSCLGSNIAAGSSEIQRNLIAWVGVGLPRV